jgi:hypothetical protein
MSKRNASAGAGLRHAKQPPPRRRIAHGPVKPVALVGGSCLRQVHLRHQQFPAAAAEAEMHVRRAPRVGHRLDGGETVGAVGIGGGAAIAPEIGVQRLRAVVMRMMVAAMGIGLPDLDQHARQRLAGPWSSSQHRRCAAAGPAPVRARRAPGRCRRRGRGAADRRGRASGPASRCGPWRRGPPAGRAAARAGAAGDCRFHERLCFKSRRW